MQDFNSPGGSFSTETLPRPLDPAAAVAQVQKWLEALRASALIRRDRTVATPADPSDSQLDDSGICRSEIRSLAYHRYRRRWHGLDPWHIHDPRF